MKSLHQELFDRRVRVTSSTLELVPMRPTVAYAMFGVWIAIALTSLVAFRGWGAGVMAGTFALLPLYLVHRYHDLSRHRIVFDKQKGRLFVGDVVDGEDTFRSATQAAEQIPIADIRALEVLHGTDGVDSWSELNVVRSDGRRVHLFATNDGKTVSRAARKIGEAFNLPVTSEPAD